MVTKSTNVWYNIINRQSGELSFMFSDDKSARAPTRTTAFYFLENKYQRKENIQYGNTYNPQSGT